MAGELRVEVVYALPERCWRRPLVVPEGATVADALALFEPGEWVPGLVVDTGRLAIFGKLAGPDAPLHDGDRIEILRPLEAAPKPARRRRAEANPVRRR